MSHDMDIKSHGDELLQATGVATEHFEHAEPWGVPRRYIPDTFVPEILLLPPLNTRLTTQSQVRHVPGWFPGTGFK